MGNQMKPQKNHFCHPHFSFKVILQFSYDNRNGQFGNSNVTIFNPRLEKCSNVNFSISYSNKLNQRKSGLNEEIKKFTTSSEFVFLRF